MENPYLGYLGLADEIIVTMDSISMLSEAVATAKPIYMFNFDPRTAGEVQTDFRLGAFLYRWLMVCGPNKLSRDISIVHRHLLNNGHVCWLGDNSLPLHSMAALTKDTERAVVRVKQLLRDKMQGETYIN